VGLALPGQGGKAEASRWRLSTLKPDQQRVRAFFAFGNGAAHTMPIRPA